MSHVSLNLKFCKNDCVVDELGTWNDNINIKCVLCIDILRHCDKCYNASNCVICNTNYPYLDHNE